MDGQPRGCGRGNRRLTVDGELHGDTATVADGVLHQAAVDIVVSHEDAGDGEDLLVGGEEQAGVVAQRPPVLQPGVGGFGAILMRAVEGEELAELQHRRGGHQHLWLRDGDCGRARESW